MERPPRQSLDTLAHVIIVNYKDIFSSLLAVTNIAVYPEEEENSKSIFLSISFLKVV